MTEDSLIDFVQWHSKAVPKFAASCAKKNITFLYLSQNLVSVFQTVIFVYLIRHE